MMPTNEEMKHLKGSKVKTLPNYTHSKKYDWYIEVQFEIMRSKPYDPQSLCEDYYFFYKREVDYV